MRRTNDYADLTHTFRADVSDYRHGNACSGRLAMFQKILVPVDLADPEFVKPALDSAVELARTSGGAVRLINVIPMTPVMLAEYVPPDFDVQQRGSAEEALAIVAKESGLDPAKVSTVVRQGGIYHEVLEE